MAAPRICSVNNCDKAAYKRGICNSHYIRLRTYGDVHGGGPQRERSSGPCKVDRCERPAKIRGWCGLHYNRVKRHGNADVCLITHGAALDWVKDHIAHTGTDCLAWPFNRNQYGYAVMRSPVTGVTTIASRIMCTQAHGPAQSESQEAAHNCGKGHLGCMNPGHLQWKTPVENQADRIVHGTTNRGERQWSSKLTAGAVRSIRRDAERHTQQELADKYGVRQSAISKIILRHNWAWLD